MVEESAMNQRDKLFRKWYDAREGTKSESFAFDVWCAAWELAQNPPELCDCHSPTACDFHDKCLKGMM